MKVLGLRLRDYRNHADLKLSFEGGPNVLLGPNGAGKTNALEALYALSLGRSYRADGDLPLIRYGEKAAYAEATALKGDRKTRISVLFSKEGKKASLDGKPLSRLSELQGQLNVTLFSPEDAALFSGPPGERRNFLDIAISREDREYLKAASAYARLLKDRNALLKALEPDREAIFALTEEMVNHGALMAKKRASYIKRLGLKAQEIASLLYGEKRTVRLVYKPFVEEAEDYKAAALNYYRLTLDSDLKSGSTGGGLHREDYRLLLDEKDVGLYGSQGENRLAALSLKLSPYYLAGSEAARPVVLLDDATSELDEEHKRRLYALMEGLEQCILTAAEDPVGLRGHRIEIGNSQ